MDSQPNYIEMLRREISDMQKEIAVLDDRSKSNLDHVTEVKLDLEKETDKIIIAYKSEVADLKKDIDTLKKELDSVYTIVQRARGGFFALATLGAIFGWILTQWQSIQALMGKGH